ncbi:MAG: hypothetical protein ACTHQM_26605 [Thermoanaerobaculia bacterium]
MIDWLRQRGVTASPEVDQLMNSASERAKRTWSDGVANRVLTYHLKPADAVSPDRCVRIYFDWDDARKIVVVAYIGRHL